MIFLKNLFLTSSHQNNPKIYKKSFEKFFLFTFKNTKTNTCLY